MHALNDWFATIDGYIGGSAWFVYLLLGAGLFFTLYLKFPQVRYFRHAFLMVTGKYDEKGAPGDTTHFRALTTALSGTVGTGNIAGVAAAIGFGGPGAVFWMWIVAFLGASTAYIESALGQIYKEEDEGQYRGGPAYYIEKAMGQKWYAWIFAITTIIATGLLLPGVQSNAIANATEVAFGGNEIVDTFAGPMPIAKLITGLAVTAVLGIIIFGGVKRIAHVTQIVVPFMALTYILLALGIIIAVALLFILLWGTGPVRRAVISKPLLAQFRKVLPPLSRTEQEALDAGTVWWDAELFSGRPDWMRLADIPDPQLSEEEQAFIDGAVATLCDMLDDWRITHEEKDLPPEVWEFMRREKFLGMIIPKEYSGLGFSALANRAVLSKIASICPLTSSTIGVPNSLGPAELLLNYGTEEQKAKYLPDLATGERVAAFATTQPVDQAAHRRQGDARQRRKQQDARRQRPAPVPAE